MYNINRVVVRPGIYFNNNSVILGIYSTKAEKMLLEIYKDKTQTIPFLKIILDNAFKTNNIFGVEISCLDEGMAYVWRIVNNDYSYSPTILDPYSKCSTFIEGEWRNIIIKDEFKESNSRPKIPWEKTIIYELHVGHFTKSCADIEEEFRGTLLGVKEKIPYLKSLGVTTVELLPIFKWNHDSINNHNPETKRKLEDVWGYNPISFFQIDEEYSSRKLSDNATREMKELVEELHNNNMEIILDVVYNHTGEGGVDGSEFNFKHLAPETYYKISSSGEFMNCSGTGNTLNTHNKVVRELVIDSMLYWSECIGVDGFRFDLASILEQDEKGRWDKNGLLTDISNHPILREIKLISESWDAKGSYDVGRMPLPVREWSDYFRDTIRQFVKGDQGVIKSVADCLQGTEIYFSDHNKSKFHMIHFITAHDGFTLWDLVSYNIKHNDVNGEDGRDGHNANYSYNWGVEGDSSDIEIINIRKRIIRNLMAILLLSRGVPMILMGDEAGRTQQGNNNAFCQDNETVWFDWIRGKEFNGQYLFIKRLIDLRNKLDYFNDYSEESYTLSWHGIFQNSPDWSYCSRSIGCLIQGKESLFIIANSYHESLEFQMPQITGRWVRLIDTYEEDIDESICEKQICDNKYIVRPYSVLLFRLENN